MKCYLNPNIEADCVMCRVKHSCFRAHGFRQRTKGRGNQIKKHLTIRDKQIIKSKQYDELFLSKLLNNYNLSLTDISRATKIPKADLHAKLTNIQNAGWNIFIK